MNRAILSVLLLAYLLPVNALLAQQSSFFLKSAPAQNANTLPGRVLVKLTPEAFASGRTPYSLLADATTRYAVQQVSPWLNPGLVAWHLPSYKTTAAVQDAQALGLQRIMMVRYGSTDDPRTVAAALRLLPAVEYAEPLYRRRAFGVTSLNDAELNRLWYLDSVGLNAGWNIQRADSSAVIGIVDTGLFKEHEDLADAFWVNKGESGLDGQGRNKRTNGVDDDGNGLVDDWWGYDFGGADGYMRDNDPSPGSEPHGTHVAGTAGATGNNGKGIAGAAYGARLLVVKSCSDDQNPDITGGFEGMLYAAKMGARVINCSWGGPEKSQAEQEVVDVVTRDYNALIVAAAGNDGDLQELIYPAAYRGVASVAALHNMNYRADFSHYNYRVDLSAPGVFIYSTIPGNSNYGYEDGTSMSSPIVAGIAALVRLKYPALNAQQTLEVLRVTATDVRGYMLPDERMKMGTGRVNAAAALTAGPSARSARMISYTVTDASGDGVLEAGEHAELHAVVRNILAPATAVTAQLVPETPGLTVDNATYTIGDMTTGQTITVPAGKFGFTVPDNAIVNGQVVLKVAVSTADRTDTGYVVLPVRPTYLTTDLNNIAATFNSRGNIGYDGLSGDVGDPGDGVQYKGSVSLLWHGGVIVATGSDHVSDVLRTGPQTQGTADGFRMTKPYRLATSPDSLLQTGTAQFSDAHLDTTLRVGVTVDMNTFEYRNPLQRDILLVLYKVRNTNATALTNLYCGMYTDWDLQPNGVGDVLRLDTALRTGIIHNTLQTNMPYIGVAMLGNQGFNFRAIDNNDQIDDITTSFGADKKFAMLSGGISRGNIGPADVSMMTGGGPVGLQPNEQKIFGFAILAGQDQAAVQGLVSKAQALFNQAVGIHDAATAGGYARAEAMPNPTSGYAVLRLTTSTPGSVQGTLYDALGRAVGAIPQATVGSGTTDLPLDMRHLPPGVYFYQLNISGNTLHGRIVII